MVASIGAAAVKLNAADIIAIRSSDSFEQVHERYATMMADMI